MARTAILCASMRRESNANVVATACDPPLFRNQDAVCSHQLVALGRNLAIGIGTSKALR